MRVLVFSDTHGRVEPAIKILKKEYADKIFHAGDFYRDATILGQETTVPIYKIAGNCDTFEEVQEEKLIQLEGKKILLIHGHQHGVKTGYQRLFYRAMQDGVDAVVFGHTHIPLNSIEQGILFFNPGCIHRPVYGQTSYGILNITEDEINGEIIYI